MKSQCSFLLDTSVFVQAHRNYSLDLFPSFWKFLIDQANLGRLFSIDRVCDELARGNDDLKDWAQEKFAQFFQCSATQDVMFCYPQVIQWANDQGQYLPGAKTAFAKHENADAWLVAYAMAQECKCTIVTMEKLNPNKKNGIPLPNVCQAFGVPYIDLLEMLRRLGFRS